MVDEPDRLWQEEANHPETSAERLIELSADAHLRSVVASNPSAPASLLEQLAEDQDPQVRLGVAGNPNTPWPTLEHLAWEFPCAFLHNPAGPLQMVACPEQISTKETFWGALPSPWWSWLKSYPVLSTSQAVHLHVQYAGEATHLYDVPHDEEEGVLLTRVELLTAASEQGMYGHILGDSTVSGQPLCQNIIRASLQRLAHGLDPEVRQAVASHPQTPAEVLQKLAQDEDPMVRKGVAEQMQTPEEILLVLAQDKDPMVRLVVAKREQTPRDELIGRKSKQFLRFL